MYTPSKRFACGTILVALDMAELKQGQTRAFGHSDGEFATIATICKFSTTTEAKWLSI